MDSNAAVPGTSQMGYLPNMPYYVQPGHFQEYNQHLLQQNETMVISTIFWIVVFIIIIVLASVIWFFRILELKYNFKNKLELVRSVTDPNFHEDRSKTFVRMAGLEDPFIGAMTSVMSERENKKKISKALGTDKVTYEDALAVAVRQGQIKLVNELFKNNVTDKEIYKTIGGKLSKAQIAALRKHYEGNDE